MGHCFCPITLRDKRRPRGKTWRKQAVANSRLAERDTPLGTGKLSQHGTRPGTVNLFATADAPIPCAVGQRQISAPPVPRRTPGSRPSAKRNPFDRHDLRRAKFFADSCPLTPGCRPRRKPYPSFAPSLATGYSSPFSKRPKDLFSDRDRHRLKAATGRFSMPLARYARGQFELSNSRSLDHRRPSLNTVPARPLAGLFIRHSVRFWVTGPGKGVWNRCSHDPIPTNRSEQLLSGSR